MHDFNTIMEDFLFHCRYEKNLTTATLKAYSIDLTQFSVFLNERDVRHVSDIDKTVIRAYLKPLTESAKPKTIKRKMATLKAFFTHLEFEDTIAVNPFRKMKVNIALDRTLPLVMSLEEVRRLFDHLYRQLKRSLTPFQKNKLVRDIAILEMLFATGMRVSELCNLRCRDVDLVEGTVKIFGKGRKERQVPLCQEEVMEILKRYRANQITHPDNPFFCSREGRPIKDATIRILIEKHATDAGLAKKITPHTFRHSLATLLLENGVDIRNIQQLLGHSSIVTTQIYAKVNDAHQRKLLGTVHPRMNL